jgi:uncharacterized protein YqgV (UPF0045/DUF77 family)
MKLTVEISLYPLTENYKTEVLAFLEKLKKYPDIEIQTNGLSTQLFGDYEQIMQLISKEIKGIFETQKAVVVMKLAQGILKFGE